MTFKEHTVKSYDKDLELISTTVEDMSELVLQSIDMVKQMLEKTDDSLINKISKHDKKINALNNSIEHKVTSVLALRQPMAIDLRYIVASLKVSSNLERMGDQAKNIIKKISKIAEEEFKVDVEDSLCQMIKNCQEMLKKSVIAFNNQDMQRVEEVLEQDDQIDSLYKNFFKTIDEGNFSKDQVKKVVNTFMIAKSFERLADHSTNIAHITEFVVNGESS